ncbi:MAG: YhbY family RNA-binding protein [Candidatus Poseidoniaceae archaeon]
MSVPNHITRQAKDASLPITMRVGKSGLTDAVVVELEGQLSSRTLVKVKVNRGLYTRDDLRTVWNIMAEKTNSTVVFARGNVSVFWRN